LHSSITSSSSLEPAYSAFELETISFKVKAPSVTTWSSAVKKAENSQLKLCSKFSYNVDQASCKPTSIGSSIWTLLIYKLKFKMHNLGKTRWANFISRVKNWTKIFRADP
jgi:hypothetical protein